MVQGLLPATKPLAAPFARRKNKLLHDHAATVFEDFCRARHADAARYWEADAEFDFVRRKGEKFIVSEVKFKSLTKQERSGLNKQVAAKWGKTRLGQKTPASTIEILDISELADA